MFSALCPQCGGAIYASTGGSQLVGCARCFWSGQVTFHHLPGSQNAGQNAGQNGNQQMIGGGSPGFVSLGGIVGSANIQPLMPDETSERNPLDVRREALIARLDAAENEVYNELQCLDATDWQMPAWRRYERLQEAHAAFYRALGGVQMGEYHPARAKLDEALVRVLLWALLTLDAVER